MITLGSLFDGAGGFPFAAQICGIEPVWASEIEPFPIEVTKKRFPKMNHLGDITNINGAEIEPVDIITFGSPCQDLSVVGKRAGLEGERSGLFMEAVRIIKEMRSKTNGRKPVLAIWENVPGAFSSNGGEDFRVVLEELCKINDPDTVIPRPPEGCWADAGEIVGAGHSLGWRVLDAQYWGVPQRRRRIFLVADFTGGRAGEVLFKREGLSRDFASCRESWQGTPADTALRFGASSVAVAVDNHPADSRVTVSESGKVQTLVSQMGTGGNNVPMIMYGICSYDSNAMKSPNPDSGVYEAETAQTLAQNGGNPSCNQGGMVVLCVDMGGGKSQCVILNQQSPTLACTHFGAPAVCYRKTAHPMHADEAQGWEENAVADTLNVYDNSEAKTPQVVLCVRERCGCEGGGKGLLIQDDVSNALQTSNDQFVVGIDAYNQALTGDKSMPCRASSSDPDKVPCVLCYALDRSAYNQGENAQFDMGIDDEGTAYTVVSQGPGAVCYAIGNGQADQLALSDVPGALNCMHDQQAVMCFVCGDIIVRRLTPTECARLQGMPDWWCDDVPHADSAEYKMWGNGMALPCVLYVMEGVAEVLKGETK